MNAQFPLAPRLPTDGASSESFRLAMRHLAGAVSVITSGQGLHRTGMTATSVNSLSLAPPSLIVCINHSSSILPVLRDNGTFGVNVLAATHRDVADRFAGRTGVAGPDRYAGADWIELVTGAPLLADALAAIDCTVETIVDWTTHALVIGRVEAVHAHGGEQALVYWRGGYVDI